MIEREIDVAEKKRDNEEIAWDQDQKKGWYLDEEQLR